MSKQTAVVILNWNGRELMEKFLPTLVANTPAERAEIVVADNGSTDDSVSFLEKNYPLIKIIRFDKNYGFAGGYNRAFEGLDNEYAVLLNSDVEVSEGWLTRAIDYLDSNPEVVALQPKILSYSDRTRFEYAGAAGGYLDMFGYPFCRGRIFNKTETDSGQYDAPAEALWASGACMFVRLAEYKSCGGLDDYFFAHQEEIDMCWRLRARGKRIVCLPASVVYHVGGATLNMEHPRKTFLNFRNNLLMVYKNIPQKYYRRVMFFRFFADYAAAFQFLLKGRWANAKAVVQARKEFAKQKINYAAIRKENLQLSVSDDFPEGVVKKSIFFC